MSDVENLVLPMLQRIQTELTGMVRSLDTVWDDLQQLKLRMINVEENMVGMNRRMDSIDIRLDRIERRLELVDG